MKTRFSVSFHVLFAAVPVLLSAVAGAATLDDSLFSGDHVLSVGAVRQSVDARLAATNPDFRPVELTLRDLGVGNRDYSYYVDYRFRFRPRWAVFASAYSFGSGGGRNSTRDFNYDGVEFTAGTTLNASLDVDAYILDVMYRSYSSERVEVMLGAGLHALDLGTSIAGQVQVDDAGGEFRQTGSTLLAPVPNIRGTVDWVLTETLGVNLVAGWLSANVDSYDGAFVYAHLKGSYRVTDKLGISLGYQVTDIDLTEARRFSDLSFDLQLDGPTLAISYRF
jgi:hypothetical protein